MDGHIFTIFLSVLLTTQVLSFTILRRHERGADLTEALAVLQRHRRRVDFGPIGSWEDAQLTEEDVSDWLNSKNSGGRRQENGFNAVWSPDSHFKDITPSLKYGFNNRNRSPLSMTVEPSKEELESIFGSSKDKKKLSNQSAKQKVKVEKVSQEKVTAKGVKSNSDNKYPTAVIATTNDDNISLNSLTKEELTVLTRAVEKLQKQAIKFSEKTVETPESKITTVEAIDKAGNPKSMTIVQPASKDELNSVFEGAETPVVKETEVVVEKSPDSSAERIMEKQVISNVSPKENENSELDLIKMIASELRDNVADDAEKDFSDDLKHDDDDLYKGSNSQDIERDWRPEHKYRSHNPSMKRTTKRSAPLPPMPVQEIYFKNDNDDDDEDKDKEEDNDVVELLDTEIESPVVKQFIVKILELQAEIDRLKLVSQLEDLENDVLTDALNEATLMQRGNTVSDMEFESVKQAIKIEQAIQDLKRSANNRQNPVDLRKRGEPWRRSPSNDVEVDDADLDSFRPPSIGGRVTKGDLQRLLGQSYLMMDQDSTEFDPDLVSFLMSHSE